MTAFLIQGLTVVKQGKTLLRVDSVELARGEALAILGDNGAGKSLLLRSAACIEPDARGRVELWSAVYKLPLASPAQGPWPAITLAFQHLALWPHLTGRENIMLPWRRARTESRLSSVDLAHLFTAMDLTDVLDKLPSEMSGGERQRTSVARAIALGPGVLLLDEPSSASDARRALRLAQVLKDVKGRGAAILFATHNLGFAAHIADRYLFLQTGRPGDSGLWRDLDQSTNGALQAFLRVNSFRSETGTQHAQ